jgi:hypothetical protein
VFWAVPCLNRILVAHPTSKSYHDEPLSRFNEVLIVPVIGVP